MIGYVTIGTNDLARHAKFYDAIAKELGGKRTMEAERYIGWGRDENSPSVLLIKPLDGKAATAGNGSMTTFFATDRAMVDRVYKTALSLGGKDEGPPGERSPTFYAAYFRDLEGNKLAVFAG